MKEEQKKKGLVVEPFRVGALNRIRLQRDPEPYRDLFSLRNVCANGRLWDGKDGERDFAAEHVAVTGKDKISQNIFSMGFVMRYGKRPFLVPNLVTEVQRKGSADSSCELASSDASHVVVKVLPGGDRYRVCLLDAADESMRVKAVLEREA